MFNYDWFHGAARQEQIEAAKWSCTLGHFPDFTREECETRDDVQAFWSELEVRQLVYLRDGFSYEVKNVPPMNARAHLVFECEPVDDHYKVGAFVVTVPFEEIVRVEVFAVHPCEKPEDMPQITGFRHQPEPIEARTH